MKKTISTLILLLALTVAMIGQEASIHKIRGCHCAIFPKETFAMIGSSERFTPTLSDIEVAEQAIWNDLKTLNSPIINQEGTRRCPFIHKKIRKYKRQYVGYVNPDGVKILYINCFRSQRGEFVDWDEKIVNVLDGCSNYWTVQYNLETNKLFELSINGGG